jgi:hypothetical protein
MNQPPVHLGRSGQVHLMISILSDATWQLAMETQQGARGRNDALDRPLAA